MNPTKTIHFFHRPPARTVALAFALAAATGSDGATVNLSTTDLVNTSSFNAAGNWNPSAAPSAGNDYVVAIQRLRTPAATGDFTFAGDSLTLSTTGGNLTFKGNSSNTITIPHLILAGGLIDHLNAATQTFT